MKNFKPKNRDFEHLLTDIGSIQITGKKNTITAYINSDKRYQVFLNETEIYNGKSLYHALLKFHRIRKLL